MEEPERQQDWREHVDRRLDRQDNKLDRIERVMTRVEAMLQVFEAGKIGGAVFKWLVTVGAAVAALWASFHFGK